MSKPNAAIEQFLEAIRNGTTASDNELEEARRLAEQSVAEEHEEDNEHGE